MEKMRSVFYSESSTRKKCEAFLIYSESTTLKKTQSVFFKELNELSSQLAFLYILDYCFNSVFETVICFKLGFDLSYGVMNG